MSDSMPIGKVVADTGVSADTLRYYEKIGLLPPIAKSAGGQRRYDRLALNRLAFIRRAQKLGFSLEEIRQLIALDQSSVLPKPEVRQLVSTKLKDIDELLMDLQTLKGELSNLLDACQNSGNGDKCPILEGLKDDE